MKFKLFALFLFLFANSVWAATWYVRPASGEYGAEDGTSYDTAFDGFADVIWGVSGVNAGDTLCVYGTFVGATESDVSGITLRVDQSGTDSSTLVTVDGDCDGDGIKAELDGNNEVAIGIRTAIASVSQTTYTLVKNIVLRQYTNKAIVTYNVTADSASDAYQTWDEIEVYDHGDGGVGDNGIDSRGRYITITNSYFEGIDEDAVYHNGKYFRADNITVRDFSRATTGGDGIQLAGEVDGYWVSNFDCIHKYDTKQCFIVSAATDTGANGVFEDFRAECKLGAGTTNCIYVTGDGAKIRRGEIIGGYYGVAVEGSVDSVNMTIENIIQRSATRDGLAVFTGAGLNNVVKNTVMHGNGRHGIFLSNSNAGTIINNITTSNASCGINRGIVGHIESYNNSYGNVTNFCIGTETTAGTGSISVDPLYVGGASPVSANGFRLKPTSSACNAGSYTGTLKDYWERRVDVLNPSIGPTDCNAEYNLDIYTTRTEILTRE